MLYNVNSSLIAHFRIAKTNIYVYQIRLSSTELSSICVYAENEKLHGSHTRTTSPNMLCACPIIIIATETKKLLFSHQTPAPNSSQQTMDGIERERKGDHYRVR